MNSSNQSSGGSLALAIGLCLAVILVIIILSLVSYYFCNRSSSVVTHRTGNTAPPASSINDQDSINSIVEDTLIGTCPKLLYSQVKCLKGEASVGSCCSICLGDYKDNDMLRLLPKCSHLFHFKCLDSWLRLHPTCPICRNSSFFSSLAEEITTTDAHGQNYLALSVYKILDCIQLIIPKLHRIFETNT
ncbi:putative RING-H2 finger protein ATL71 [Mercurialis annua]|uniref:putative RING-H2 finger protein ATL71 n=1 Tax=Mercurialis annua TaxID=3986 RepID=UPI00215E0818|nr:putative RING-H2 finger protein ATL71 [Mercurialis annua]